MDLARLKVIVSGAASGLGRHFALRLAEAGAQVAIGDVNEGGLAETVALTRGMPGRVYSRRLDVSKESEVEAFVAWAGMALDGMNALINNAAIARDALLVKAPEAGPVRKLNKERWDEVVAVNLTGATMMAREAVARIASSGTRPAVVVNISSVARHGSLGQSAYVASKAALAANTRTWALEWGPLGIRCAAVAPGLVETPMTRALPRATREAMIAAIPVGRIGQPEDVWQAVKFALECEYFNGRTVDVDGGGFSH
jgi:3-oxoacyl-[acyl-carrier protein] reductase